MIEMTLTELQHGTGRISPELDSGGVLRLVNRKTGRVIGYVIRPADLPLHLREAEELLGVPEARRGWHGRAYPGHVRRAAVRDLADRDSAAAGRALGVPESTVRAWRRRAAAQDEAAS